MNYKTLDLKKVIVNLFLMPQKKKNLPTIKTEELLKESEGLSKLSNSIGKGVNVIRGYIIESHAKNMTLKELEISRKENVEKIEKIYNNEKDSYLIKKRLADILNEINEKYYYAVDEVEKVYSSNKKIDEKLASFEEIKALTNAYYRIIMEETERIKITSS